jgi:hypothetical protein
MNFSSMMFGARLNIKAKEYSLQEVGVTPFIAILRQTKAESTKHFTNKTANDIILKKI